MTIALSLLSGLTFGFGLIISGMTNPTKVLNFLDLAGTWDPSLALVMGGAIAIGFVAFSAAGKRQRSFLDLPMQMPTVRQIDRRLIGGSLTFGVGWGLAGICPGPALVLAGAGIPQGLLFVGAMLVGMKIFEFIEDR
ncbi:DUF6691 family protein [Propionivibrio sp.]|uniref:DUF6691 family protein n=1 Tax=Propionivibrio sp. TaxID=2212460 RepID=UPI00261DD3EB|nr:DUF6691 family protein [Propionivibrio sp.]